MNAYKQGISKKDFLAELKMHQKADAFLKGTYGEGTGEEFKGCAVGCSIESIAKLKGIALRTNVHEHYETYLGVPQWLARLEDFLFENISVERSKTWPVEFAKAIRIGADLEKAKGPIMTIFLKHSLVSLKKAKYDEAKFPQVKAAIEQTRAAVKQMILAHKTGKGLSEAQSAADSAADSADSADSAADSAYSAAYSAADSARSSAYSAAYEYYANRVLEVLRETK